MNEEEGMAGRLKQDSSFKAPLGGTMVGAVTNAISGVFGGSIDLNTGRRSKEARLKIKPSVLSIPEVEISSRLDAGRDRTSELIKYRCMARTEADASDSRSSISSLRNLMKFR